MTITQIEYIIAVDQYQSFSAAAEACFVTQPTLSMQIKKLEELLDVVIFDRGKQPIIPTEIGKKIIEQGKIVLQESKKIDDIILQHKGEISGELKLGVIPTLAPYLLPLFVGDISRKYPNLKLIVKELQTEEIISQLNKDLIDVGLLVTPINENGIHELPLLYEEIMVYTNPNYKFEGQLEVSLNDVASPDIWLLSAGHCFRDQMINLCSYQRTNKMNSSLPISYESGSLETLIRLVDKEGGFTLLPELAVDLLPEDGKDQIRTFVEERPMREVSLVYARNFAKASLIKVLEETIKENVPKEMLTRERGSVVEWR
ncbi:LysR family transcriptional regulator [Flammeovirga yaeyamensis]|uniref:LysR family transcriptional regulator n=1 Tax=Flammeovirga yaeyamensis TaxID=367791 RepID=A0AAX1N127_9BACT|nr:hydrogen peroxide-inducible genes activator [Flammeovirga yaeyamensis]MBB3698341.1 LysR family hydrogen peroxide-inducible transcriptional activator [Flammeovirga yaeyamensis]NMF34306.1 hydrogen peroxide-inducible genes activator [Flammeovirga yaeyamensis]QWG01289.1 LysR family transcriptional regulator [Flammeovirga yaeyamensis]